MISVTRIDSSCFKFVDGGLWVLLGAFEGHAGAFDVVGVEEFAEPVVDDGE